MWLTILIVSKQSTSITCCFLNLFPRSLSLFLWKNEVLDSFFLFLKSSHLGELSELHSQGDRHIDAWGKRSGNKAAEFSLAQAVFYDLRAP